MDTIRRGPTAQREDSPSPDEALALRCRAGDLAAFDLLAHRYQPRLYGYALRMVGHSQEAEDLTQETLLRAFASLGRFDANQPFGRWLFGIAAHVCRDWLRWRFRRREQASAASGQAYVTATPRDEAIAAEEQARVAQAVRRLPLKYREVVVLHYMEDMGYEEVAATLGIRPDAARRRALRAREMLQRYLGGQRP